MFEMLASVVSILNVFDLKWETAFYRFIYDPSVIIQFGSCIEKKQVLLRTSEKKESRQLVCLPEKISTLISNINYKK